MQSNLKYISSSKKGQERERNQDRLLIIERDFFYLFIIFDGVSSYPYSYLFIDDFIKKIKSRIDFIDNSGNNLDNLLFEAHSETVRSRIEGMSTISALFLEKGSRVIKFTNIGDSRIYIFTKQFLEKITSDDSLPGRENILTKCLGIDSLSIEDFKTIEMETECEFNYLLCTDGFYKLMEENLKEYFKILNFKNFQNIKNKISSLQKRKNQDDSSYVIIKNEIPG